MRFSAFLLACLLVIPPALPAAFQSGDGWVNARTANFNIVSNANEREIRRTAVKLEEFVDVVSRLFNARSTAYGPVTVVAFRDDRSFRPYKPLYNGKPANISGFFQRSGDEPLIALDINAASEDRPFAVIFHEYTHLLTSGSAQPWPPWLLEGLAEFYSSFETQGTEARLGIPIAEHVELLREVPMIPLAELFAVTQDSPTYNEGQRQNIFYAESWALVHYLMLGNKQSRQPQLRQFIRLLGEGTAIEAAFRDSFQTDYARMETEIRSYVSRQAYPGLLYRLEQASATANVAVQPLSPAESQFHLGNVLLRTDRGQEAEGLFKKALALDATAPQPHEGLGFLAAQRDQPESAIEHLQRAIERKSTNYLTHYIYAHMLQELAFKGSSAPAPDVVRRMLDAATTAATLRPGFLAAHHLAGYIYLAGRVDPVEAIPALTRTQALFPQDARTAITLAALHARRGDLEAARRSLETTLKTAGGSDAVEGRRMLTQIEAQLAAAERRRSTSAGGATSAETPAGPARPASPAASGASRTQTGVESTGSPAGLPADLARRSQMTGVLSGIECGGTSPVLVLTVARKPVRFAIAKNIRFFRTSATAAIKLACGPIDAPATVYFDGGADPVLQGEAVAVVVGQ